MKFTVGAGIKFGLGLAIGMAAFDIINEVGGTIYSEVRRAWNEGNEDSFVEEDQTVDLPRKKVQR